MTFFDYFLVAWFAFAAFMTITSVGKPRKPTEPLTAAIAVTIQAALIIGVLWARGVL